LKRNRLFISSLLQGDPKISRFRIINNSYAGNGVRIIYPQGGFCEISPSISGMWQ